MKLYIKQKVFTWGDRFSIYDEQGNSKYMVEGEILTFGKKLHVFDLHGMEVAYIEQQLFSFLPRYTIYRDGNEFSQVIKEFSFFNQEYSVDGPGWSVHGNFFDHDYEIIDRDQTIASIAKEWFTFGDAYEISIIDGIDEIDVLSVVLVIDACIESQNQ